MMQSLKPFFPCFLTPLRSIHGVLVRRFTTSNTHLGIFSSRKTLFLNSLSQTRSFSSSVSATVAVPTPTPTPTTFPPPITESTLLQAVESSQRHFIEHLAPHLTPSILPSVQASFDLTTRCLAFCILYRLSYPQTSVHHLLHPLILTSNGNPVLILNELARARERLNVDSTSVFDALIKAYCELKMPDEALESFYLMKEKGFLPQIETCNQMLKLFLKLNRSHAKEFIGHMETIGLKPNIYKYNTFIHEGEKFEAACVMFQTMKDTGLFKDAYGNDSFMFVMYKVGSLEEASDLLPKMLESESGLVPHALTYDALIHKWCKIGVVECYRKQNTEDLDKAVAYKDEMISRGIEPSIVTYTLLIDALFQIGGSMDAEDMIKEMQEKGLKQDNVYTYNTLMCGWFKCGVVDFRFYDEMVKKRIQPTVLTYNTMMLGYCREHEMKEARQLLDEMKTRGFKPDHISYNLLIGGYSEGGDVKEAFRVRDEMLKNGFDPTFTTYDALIIGLCNNNEVEHAQELLKEMVGKGICTLDDWRYKVLTKIIKETPDKVDRNDIMADARFRKILEDDKYLYFNQPLD